MRSTSRRCFRWPLRKVRGVHPDPYRKSNIRFWIERRRSQRAFSPRTHYWRAALFSGDCAEPGADVLCIVTKNE
jgi:hypothetical protein